MASDVWQILGILTPILLIIYWGGQNAVWGAFTAGVILSFLVMFFFVFKGEGFDWYIVGKGAVLGTMAGFVFELFGKIFGSR